MGALVSFKPDDDRVEQMRKSYREWLAALPAKVRQEATPLTALAYVTGRMDRIFEHQEIPPEQIAEYLKDEWRTAASIADDLHDILGVIQ